MVAKLEDLREWLTDRIDGSEETRGEDSLISHFINQIDALPSEIAEPRGCPTPGACSAVEELADLKQRLLPQYLGRAERAEKARQMAVVERDALLEKLRAATTMVCAPSATAAPSDIVKRIVEGGATRILFKADGYCPSCGHNRNISSVSSIYMGEGKHACQLCGTGWLEIKRRDMKGEPVECGYDRTASLNAGHYVCTCGACIATLREGSHE